MPFIFFFLQTTCFFLFASSPPPHAIHFSPNTITITSFSVREIETKERERERERKNLYQGEYRGWKVLLWSTDPLDSHYGSSMVTHNLSVSWLKLSVLEFPQCSTKPYLFNKSALALTGYAYLCLCFWEHISQFIYSSRFKLKNEFQRSRYWNCNLRVFLRFETCPKCKGNANFT